MVAQAVQKGVITEKGTYLHLALLLVPSRQHLRHSPRFQILFSENFISNKLWTRVYKPLSWKNQAAMVSW
jgi:hypothetical protein